MAAALRLRCFIGCLAGEMSRHFCFGDFNDSASVLGFRYAWCGVVGDEMSGRWAYGFICWWGESLVALSVAEEVGGWEKSHEEQW